MRTLDPCPAPQILLSFDFDGTLHDPSESPPIPRDFFTTIRTLREQRNAIWGINTGRSMPQVVEGFIESSFPFLPDWVIAREREIYFPNDFGRFLPHKPWNERCEKDIHALFKKAHKILKHIQSFVEEHTGAQYIEVHGDPAGIISRTEEEMEWIVTQIEPLIQEIPLLGWQRNSIYLRFGHKNYQKGSTLSEVGNLFQIPVSHILAAGDSHNDVEMLSPQHSGFAACPSNAVPAIRELIAARNGYIAKSPHGHGIVEALNAAFR